VFLCHARKGVQGGFRMNKVILFDVATTRVNKLVLFVYNFPNSFE